MTPTDVSDMTPSRFVAFATELGHDLDSWADAECAVAGRPRWEAHDVSGDNSHSDRARVQSPAH
jgi:hypothetical protein